jgi:hypothetical protein
MIIWLPSFPRSGNTLVRTILFQTFGVRTFSIYESAENSNNHDSADIFEKIGPSFWSGDWQSFLDECRGSPRQFFIKTHHGPEGSDAAIYIVRNGIVATDSYQHYLSVFEDPAPSLDDVISGRIGGFGRWEQHLEAWQPKSRPNTLILRYEDIVSDAPHQIDRIAEFTGLTPIREWVDPWAEMHALGPNFFRRGKVEIPAELSTAQIEYFLDFGNNRFWMNEFGYL